MEWRTQLLLSRGPAGARPSNKRHTIGITVW